LINGDGEETKRLGEPAKGTIIGGVYRNILSVERQPSPPFKEIE